MWSRLPTYPSYHLDCMKSGLLRRCISYCCKESYRESAVTSESSFKLSIAFSRIVMNLYSTGSKTWGFQLLLFIVLNLFRKHLQSVYLYETEGITEAEDIKKRWQEYTEELYGKDLYDTDNHEGVISHLEPDILECEVKWALGSITMNKASGGDGIPVELSQVLQDDAVKVMHSICQQIWKAHQWPQDGKMSVFIPTPKKGNAKECSNYCKIVLISEASKVMLKIL